jgi:hypothetical protein
MRVETNPPVYSPMSPWLDCGLCDGFAVPITVTLAVLSKFLPPSSHQQRIAPQGRMQGHPGGAPVLLQQAQCSPHIRRSAIH